MSAASSQSQVDILADQLAARLRADRERSVVQTKWFWVRMAAHLFRGFMLLSTVALPFTLYIQLIVSKPPEGLDRSTHVALALGQTAFGLLFAVTGVVVATLAIRYCKLRAAGEC